MREPSRQSMRSAFRHMAFLAALNLGCGDPFPPGPIIVIEGVVVYDITAIPALGAKVSLLTNCELFSGCGPGAYSITDSAGRYHVEDRRKERCNKDVQHGIRAEFPGFLAEAAYTCTAAVQRINFTLKR